MMIALATVLGFIKIFQLPMGGSITLVSMLPVALLSIEYGLGWGFVASFVYSLVQLGLGINAILGWGLSVPVLLGSIFFDYIGACTIIGISGIFRKKGLKGIVAGVALAMILRFVFHFISGVIFFGEWAVPITIFGHTFTGEYWYSLFYNGSYMLVETITTTVGAALIFKSSAINRLMAGDQL